ncbi:FRIGIDA-like protein 3 [Actinidia eriantha]|uniref:FRIGIDA-like protein 3 n=1 Tax=Actinidia eriantha TaxID=165200 RepID=UPI002584FC60|nr:FRIGIDA-like protein 3 [Actinidia eriantha]
MADKDQSMGVETTSLIEQLGKAILELESHKDAAENDVQWSEIEVYFQHLETMMMKKTEELELREKEFKEKESNTRTFLAEREAAVAAKEQDLLDRIQELKDAAFAAIAGARAHQPEPLESIDGGDDKETKVSSSLGDTNALLDASEENSPNKTDENAEGVGDEVKPHPELTQFCEQMDAKGLLNYTMENQKNIQSIRVELSIALESATEPGSLVLASLEGFYPPDDKTTQEGDKSDAVLRGMRRSCITFMEALATLLARADSGADHLTNPEIKQQAKAIADEWKPKLAVAGFNAANGNSLEAEAFLQLLVTYRIASEFDDEELCNLVLAVTHQRRAPELCRSLGLTRKMPAVVEELVKSGRQVDAVNFIHAFELTESFPPVPLLKTHLKDLRRNSQGKPGGGAAGAQNDANAQELAALRAVIRCVREYKLEADYPLDPLHKRVVQLERSNPDKKRSEESGKHQQQKKPRANGGIFGFRAPPPPAALPPGPAAVGGRQGPPVYGERTTYGGLSERYSLSGPTAYDYQTPSQTTYDQRSYYYPPDERATAAAYNAAAPSSYGSYAGSGVQSSHQQYM